MKYHYPRIKPIYPLYKLNKKNFRVGAQLGVTTEFDDEKGQFWILSNLMDGFRTFKQIVFEMKNIYPELTSIDIEKGIDLLNEEGLVEETYPGKTIDERYIANVNYFSRFCGAEKNRFEIQEKINNLNILLLGLGGGGSNIVTLLAGLGPKMIRMVDYDKIEPSNLGRQLLYREKDVGEKKTDIAKRAVREMNSLKITTNLKKAVATVSLTHVWTWGLCSRVVAISSGMSIDSLLLFISLSCFSNLNGCIDIISAILVTRILWQFRIDQNTDVNILLQFINDNPFLFHDMNQNKLRCIKGVSLIITIIIITLWLVPIINKILSV